MANFRLFYDENNGTATIVLTNVSADEVKLIGTEILKVAIEPTIGLKSAGFSDETPVIPSQPVKNEVEVAMPFTENEDKREADVVVNTTSAVIKTNPVPEDSEIPAHLLDAPIGDAQAPAISNQVETPIEETEDTVEEIPENDYVFDFGSHKNVGISALIAEDPATGFGYARWLLHKGVLKSKTPGEDVFKKVILKQTRDYYSQFPIQEKEVKDVAYVLLSSISEAEANEILSLLGFSSVSELYASENIQCYADAIKMALA